jgi:hypothetical protein
MKDTTIPLIIAILAAVVTAIGWFISNFLSRKSDDQKRRIEESTKYLERQIEEFYGPLFNVVTQIRISSDVLEDLVDKGRRHHKTPEEIGKIQNYFQANYFIPLHNEFTKIVRGKLHLIEGTKIPESFYRYSQHAIQEHSQLAIWAEMGVDTAYLKGTPYPDEIFEDLEKVLSQLMKQYTHQIEQISGKKSKKKPRHEPKPHEEHYSA